MDTQTTVALITAGASLIGVAITAGVTFVAMKRKATNGFVVTIEQRVEKLEKLLK